MINIAKPPSYWASSMETPQSLEEEPSMKQAPVSGILFFVLGGLSWKDNGTVGLLGGGHPNGVSSYMIYDIIKCR